MKFANIFTPESIAVPQEQAVVTEVQLPENVPGEQTQPLDVEQQRKIAPLPNEYIPSTLQGLKITCENINYNTDQAELDMSLLTSSLGIVQEDEIMTDVSAASVAAQIQTAAQTSPYEDSLMLNELSKTLTTDNPYRYTATVEALVKTIDTLKPVILKGLKTLSTVNTYLVKNVDIKNTMANLEATRKAMSPSKRPDEKIKDGGDDLKFYDMIVKATETHQEPEYMPEYIAKNFGVTKDVSLTACKLISKGLLALPLNRSRIVNVNDLKSVSEYYTKTITLQKVMIEMLGTLLSSLNVANLTEAGMNHTSENIKKCTSVFWTAAARLGTLSKNADLSHVAGDLQGNTYVFNVMPDWTGVILLDTGKSISPKVAADGNFGIFKPNDLSDLAGFMGGEISSKFNSITKNSIDLNLKVQQIEQIMTKTLSNQQVISEVGSQAFQSNFVKVLDTTKFMGALTLVATEAYVDISTAIIDVTRGISILSET